MPCCCQNPEGPQQQQRMWGGCVQQLLSHKQLYRHQLKSFNTPDAAQLAAHNPHQRQHQQHVCLQDYISSKTTYQTHTAHWAHTQPLGCCPQDSCAAPLFFFETQRGAPSLCVIPPASQTHTSSIKRSTHNVLGSKPPDTLLTRNDGYVRPQHDTAMRQPQKHPHSPTAHCKLFSHAACQPPQQTRQRTQHAIYGAADEARRRRTRDPGPAAAAAGNSSPNSWLAGTAAAQTPDVRHLMLLVLVLVTPQHLHQKLQVHHHQQQQVPEAAKWGCQMTTDQRCPLCLRQRACADE